MILSQSIISDIKQKSRLLFDKTSDYNALSAQIASVTNRTIGVTTLKRLFQYVRDNHKPSDYTLNTLALYLGFPSWIEYTSSRNTDSEWGYNDETVYVQKLSVGQKLKVQYLDRIVVFEVIEVDSIKILKVFKSKNSSLRENDLLWVHRIRKGEKLEAEKIMRGSISGNYRTNGEVKIIDIE